MRTTANVEPAGFVATSRQANALPGQIGLEIGIIDDDVDKCNSLTTRRSIDHLSFISRRRPWDLNARNCGAMLA